MLMHGNGLCAHIEFYGVSPWEIEVAHGYLGNVFELDETEIDSPNENVASYMRIRLPVTFSDEFFEWFGFKRWERVKSLLKEMKRRRGGSKALEVHLDFEADPRVSFVIDSDDRSSFDNSVEKLDYVLEVLEHHLEAHPDRLLVYRFNTSTRRWVLSTGGADSAQTDRGENMRKTI